MSFADLTVCALCYGDHADLARRCLGSIFTELPELPVSQLRIGLNAVGKATQDFVAAACESERLLESNIWQSSQNIHKYPMMRRMFYGRPLTTRYVMWFDDDSFLRPGAGAAAVRNALATAREGAELIGAIYTIALQGRQEAWIKAQPWHTGKPIDRRVLFVTGGWWLADVQALRSVDYPWPALDHRGGDVMLGACGHQQGWRLRSGPSGVAINADAAGVSARSPRRGFDQPPIGYAFDATAAVPEAPPSQAILDIGL